MAQIYTLDGLRVETVPPAFALYPYGAFTSFVADRGAVLGWKQHADRLANGALELWGHKLDRAQLRASVHKHFEIHGPSPASVRITVYPRTFSLAAPNEAKGCNVLISSSSATLPFTPKPTFHVQSVQHMRDLAHLKSTDLFRQIGVRRAARLAGFEDALLLDGDDVLEGVTWSVVVWKDGRVVTPGTGVLASVTVAQLKIVAEDLGWQFAYRTPSRSDLANADLILGVNVNNPARAISKIDDDDISVDAALLDAIAAAYNHLPRETV